MKSSSIRLKKTLYLFVTKRGTSECACFVDKFRIGSCLINDFLFIKNWEKKRAKEVQQNSVFARKVVLKYAQYYARAS